MGTEAPRAAATTCLKGVMNGNTIYLTAGITGTRAMKGAGDE